MVKLVDWKKNTFSQGCPAHVRTFENALSRFEQTVSLFSLWSFCHRVGALQPLPSSRQQHKQKGWNWGWLPQTHEGSSAPARSYTHTHQTKKQLQHLLPVLVVLRCSKIIRDVARCCKQLLLSSLVSAVSDAASSHMSSKSPRWDPHWRLQAFRGWGLKHQNCLRRNTHIPQPTWAGAGPNRGRKFSWHVIVRRANHHSLLCNTLQHFAIHSHVGMPQES